MKRGLAQGQVLAVLLPNIPEFAVCTLGAIEAGLVVTTINPVYTPCTRLRYQLTVEEPLPSACRATSLPDVSYISVVKSRINVGNSTGNTFEFFFFGFRR